MLPKRQSLNHRQSLHSDALSPNPNVVNIIPLLSETNGHPLHIIPRSHNAIFELHHDPTTNNSKHRSKRSRQRKDIVRVGRNNKNNEIFEDLAVPGMAVVKELIIQTLQMIVFNETTIHSGSKPGVLIPGQVRCPLFNVVNKKSIKTECHRKI